MPADSEFRTYEYIRQVLSSLGWDTRNPARGGAVYTQGEFRRHDTLLDTALGKKAPENVVVVQWDGGPRYWVVEAKRTHRERAKALREAQGYADKINDLEPGAARFATGIAGTPDQSFYVTTTYWNGREWLEVEINNYEVTGFLSLEQCHDVIDSNNHQIASFDDNPGRFLKKANEINKTLHNNEIPVADRARIMAALLLALAQDGNLRVHDTPTRLIREINGLIEDLLHRHGKEEFASVIKLTLPATEKNHRKYRKAILDVLQHLREMNIRSAINSGDDALGKFYETFLKYANGAKEMGIVLTPRHITRFAVEAIGIGHQDRVFDPACGTGGFLVSAMESIRGGDPKNYDRFRNDNLFGVEQRDDVYGLALVNMIFRGDGKSRIYDGNCFDHEFWARDGNVWYTLQGDQKPHQGAQKPFSRVLMNPPFKLTNNNETSFVDYGLSQARRRALLFAVLPSVVVSGETHEGWRRELLRRHTVLACIRFDKNLFYPVSEATYGLIVRAHEPHKSRNTVFMGSLLDDDHRPKKSKLIPDHDLVDNVERMTREVRNFLLNKPVESVVHREQCTTTIDQDRACSFSPESYIPAGSAPVNAAFRYIGMVAANMRVSAKASRISAAHQTRAFMLLEQFIATVEPSPVQALRECPHGYVPVVSATHKNNGVGHWLEVPDDLCYDHCLTVSIFNNTKPCEAFWHPYRFSALTGKVFVLRPIPELLEDTDAILYLCESITANNSWKYNYARTTKLHELEVVVPVTKHGKPDITAMGNIVRRQLG